MESTMRQVKGDRIELNGTEYIGPDLTQQMILENRGTLVAYNRQKIEIRYDPENLDLGVFAIEPGTNHAIALRPVKKIDMLNHEEMVEQLEWKKRNMRAVRKFDPYHIICQKGSWYVLGFSHHSNAIRLYAMPRIQKCEIMEERFTIPPDFSIEKHIDPEIGVWGNSGKVFKVEVEFSKVLKTFVSERIWHKGQDMRENPDGSVYLSFETNQLAQTAAWILSFAGNAKVLNPPELKEEVQLAAKKILES